jgi:hypothetical protein
MTDLDVLDTTVILSSAIMSSLIVLAYLSSVFAFMARLQKVICFTSHLSCTVLFYWLARVH